MLMYCTVTKRNEDKYTIFLFQTGPSVYFCSLKKKMRRVISFNRAQLFGTDSKALPSNTETCVPGGTMQVEPAAADHRRRV